MRTYMVLKEAMQEVSTNIIMIHFNPYRKLYCVISKNDKDEGGFSLGHFNTYSGFPDTLDAFI